MAAEFASDSPLEGAVCCELVSEMARKGRFFWDADGKSLGNQGLQSQVFWDADGKMDLFPQAVGLSKRLVLCIFFECAFGHGGSFSRPIKRERRLD